MLKNAGEKLGAFIWGANGEQLTPEQVARRRERASMAQGRAGDTSPVGHWTQGAARVVDALGGVVNERRADRNEKSGLASADEFVANDPVLAGLLGGGGGSAPDMQMSSRAAQPAVNTHDHADHAGESHNEWLRYSNQGATRNKPISPELVSAMSFLPELGVTMDVVSGGQDAEGPNRTGSTRHDHGNAADADFYLADGTKLAPSNPNHAPILTEIVSRARSNGVTGFGEGADYMGEGRVHLGFGNEAVWGAGGSSDNAPEWLRNAVGSSGGGMSPSGQSQPITGGGGDVVAALSAAMADPWVAQKYGPVIEQLMGQEQRRGDMQFQQQLKQSDPMYQAQLSQLTAQPSVDPMDAIKLETAQIELDALKNAPPPAPGAPETQKIYDPVTGQDQVVQWTGGEWVPLGGVAAPSGPMVNVENNMPGSNEFQEAFAKGDAAALSIISDSGMAAQRNIGRIDTLADLLESSPSGIGGVAALKAGEWGINIDGLNELQAAQAMISSLVPEQRQPGSGPMSDADLDLFKQSLPRIINQPGGNQMIVDTMRAIANYDSEGAAIVQRARSGELTRAEAFEALQARPNPMPDFKLGGGVSATSNGADAASALTADDLKYLGLE